MEENPLEGIEDPYSLYLAEKQDSEDVGGCKKQNVEDSEEEEDKEENMREYVISNEPEPEELTLERIPSDIIGMGRGADIGISAIEERGVLRDRNNSEERKGRSESITGVPEDYIPEVQNRGGQPSLLSYTNIEGQYPHSQGFPPPNYPEQGILPYAHRSGFIPPHDGYPNTIPIPGHDPYSLHPRNYPDYPLHSSIHNYTTPSPQPPFLPYINYPNHHLISPNLPKKEESNKVETQSKTKKVWKFVSSMFSSKANKQPNIKVKAPDKKKNTGKDKTKEEVKPSQRNIINVAGVEATGLKSQNRSKSGGNKKFSGGELICQKIIEEEVKSGGEESEEEDEDMVSDEEGEENEEHIYYGIRKKVKIYSEVYEVFSMEANLEEVSLTKMQDEKQFLNTIAPLFFTILKKHHRWDKPFLNTIREKVLNNMKFQIWNQVSSKLFLYSLLNSSSPELKVKILDDYSTFAPVPIVMPLWFDNFTDLKYVINPELLWILESYFLVVSFGLEAQAKGKSSYLNQIFEVEFHGKGCTKFVSTIDIYLNAFKGTSKKVAIVDINSQADSSISEKLISMANMLIIHIKSKKKKIKNFEEKKFQTYKKPILYLYRDSTKSALTSNKKLFETKSTELPILVQKLPHLNEIEEQDSAFKLHIEYVLKFIYDSLNIKTEKHEFGRIAYIKDFLSENLDKKKRMEIANYIRQFGELVMHFQQNRQILNTEKFLSMVPKHKEWCRLHSLIYREQRSGEREHDFDQLQKTKFELEKEIKDQRKVVPKKVLKLFLNVASLQDVTPHFLIEMANAIKVLIDKEIYNYHKYYIQLKNLELKIKYQGKKEFEQYMKEGFIDLNTKWKNIMNFLEKRTKLFNTDTQDHLIQKFNDKLLEVDKLIIGKSFSLEILWRELIYFRNFQPENPIFDNFSVEDYFVRNLRNGYPFEVIDGDNLYFSSTFFKAALGNMKEKILVLSVIGPQSSGKSTLLNFLYGCNFQTSAGRCTRGVYGTYISLKNCDKYDGIFILDTEGLLSIHHAQSNLDFDRKVTLFILAVSQVVIINVKGEMGGPLLELLTVCIKSLAELKESLVPSPEIFIVLNQYTDLNTDNVQKDINMVKEQMGDILKEKEIGLNELITLEERNIKALPNAFNQKSFPIKETEEKINFKVPYLIFVEETKLLAERLINMAIENQKRNQNNLPYDNLARWFDNAAGIWDVIKTYPNLVYFQNIAQMREDDKMKEWINNKIKATLENDKSKKGINAHFEAALQEATTVHQVEIEISNFFNPQNKNLLLTFEHHFKTQKFNEKGILDQKANFESRLNQIATTWESKLKGAFLKKLVEKSEQFGQTRINEKKLALLAKKEDISEEEARKYFELEWNEVIKDMREKLNRKRNKKSILDGVIKTYRTVYPMLPEMNCNVYISKYEEKSSTDIVQSILEKGFFGNQNTQTFSTTSAPPRPAQEQFSKRFINLTEYFTRSAKIVYLSKENFISCITPLKKKLGIISGKSKKELAIDFRNEIRDFEIEITDKGFKLLTKKEINPLLILFEISQTFDKNIAEIDLFQRLKKKETVYQAGYNSYGGYSGMSHTSAYGNRTYYEKNYILTKDLEKHLKTLKLEESKPIDFLCNLILKIERNTELISKLKHRPQYEWLLALYLHKRAPNKEIRNKFVKAEFHWELLVLEIKNTIEKKLFLDDKRTVRELGLNLVSRMADDINKIIVEINENLSQFALQLDQNAMSDLHLCVLLSIWKESEEQQWRELMNPIIQLNNSKEQQLKEFLTVLTGDYDKSCKMMAEKLIQKLKNGYHSLVVKETKTALDDFLSTQETVINRDIIQDEKDYEYMFGNKTETEKGLYYLDKFSEVMLDTFEGKWNLCVKHFINEENKRIRKIARRFFLAIEEKVSNLGRALDHNNLNRTSSMLFKIKGNKSKLNEFEIQLGQAAMLYLFDYICGVNTEEWLVEDREIVVMDEISLPRTVHGISEENSQILKREYFENETVARLDLLCHYFFEEIKAERENWDEFDLAVDQKIVEHLENQKRVMGDNAVGCDAKCPTCRRICDVKHGDKIGGSKDSQHACLKGHQVRALAGNKLYDNESSVFTCEEMEGDDPITYLGERTTWDKFIETIGKGNTNCWNFKELLDKKVQNQIDNLKYKEFWQLVGRNFSELQTNNGNKMTFCESSNKARLNKVGKGGNIHAILALDSSGSMGGGPWNALMDAVRTFLSITTGKGYVSIIRFASSSSILKEHVPIDSSLADEIPYTGGGTTFAYPIQNAYDIMNRYKGNNEEDIYFIFMSDGQAEYPSAQISNINSLHIPFHFYAIAFGGINSLLQQIATAFNGQAKTAVGEEMLKETYSKIGFEILQPIT